MATPVQMSPIFRRIPGGGLAPAAALNQVARDQAAAQKAVAAYQAAQKAKPSVPIAGTRPAINPIFSRFRGAAPFIGPALTVGFGATRVAGGESPTKVAADTATEAMLSAVGAGIGSATPLGPVGGFIGSLALPTAYSLAVGDTKPVDMRYINPADAAQMASKPGFGGLSVPAYDIPGIPDVTTPVLRGIDFSRKAPVAETETGLDQPVRDTGSPAARRPVEEQRPPVTREVPASPTPARQPQSMNELAQMYARQRVLGTEMAKGGELQRRLYEGGAAEGMPVESFMTWVEANPDLAYRLAEKRGLLPQSV